MAANIYFWVAAIFCVFTPIRCLPEQGTWSMNLNEQADIIGFTKTLYNNSKVMLFIECEGDNEILVNVEWLLRRSPCAEEYIGITRDKNSLEMYLSFPRNDPFNLGYQDVHFQTSKVQQFSCNKHAVLTLIDESASEWTKAKSKPKIGVNVTAVPTEGAKKEEAKKEEAKKEEAKKEEPKKEEKNRKKREAKEEPKPKPATNKKMDPHGNPMIGHTVTRTWEDGVYLFIVKISPAGLDEEDKPPLKFNASVTVAMNGPNGYLSAIEWPLLPFYGAMCIVYVIMGIVWMILSICNWKDLLRIQFWIGGLIFLGMLEKAVFFAEYESINATGKSVRGAVVFAELLSCLKRTVARMLVVIVSLGFGIVKPRLGPMLHKVLGVGSLYFILGSIEGCLRVLKPKGDISNQTLLAGIPLAVLDAAICWWVFTALVTTTRTLRLRRNLVKLSLYRHFTNTLIFAVLASVAFMIWSIKEHKLTSCLSDWKELWVDEAFWHLLFSVILMVIIVLWRPTINNQRYAFSPLLDAADDEAEEPMISDAYDGMKMRAGQERSKSPKLRGSSDAKSKAEEDLKWIEENIPSSVADTALPSLLDSDEEIMTTKFEMSKME